MDQFVETILLPAYNRGTERRKNSAYSELRDKARWREHKGQREEARKLRQQVRHLPSRDPNDAEYRRLRYIRYADDFLLGFNGPQHEAEEIKGQIGTFRRDELKLKLSESKTLITNARRKAYMG